MKTWSVTVTVQLVTKSYPNEYRCRVQAGTSAAAAAKATRKAFEVLHWQIKGRRLQEVRIHLLNLGNAVAPVPQGAEGLHAAEGSDTRP